MTSKPRLLISGPALRERRLRAFLSPVELAQKAGMTAQRIRDFENENHRGTKPETVRALATALGCEPTDISEIVTEVAS
jgi:DNA-binding Xre family transcriptional regulator